VNVGVGIEQIGVVDVLPGPTVGLQALNSSITVRGSFHIVDPFLGFNVFVEVSSDTFILLYFTAMPVDPE
jgi:hypothetical protein